MDILQCLTDMLHKINNPFVILYWTAVEQLQVQTTSFLLQIILNLQIKLIIKARADQRCKNLPTINEVAIIIPNEYKSTSYCNIVLTDCGLPGEPLQYYYINLNYAAYMPLYYGLLFPYGDRSQH